MSIINSDGLNTNWQLNVLKGLQAIATEVAKPLTCAEDGVTICSPASGLNVNVHDGTGIPITSTIVGADKGLDVNIIGGVAINVNLDQNDDQVQIYGSDLTAPILTNAAGRLQVDVVSIPEVEIKNDSGNPIPISDAGGSITVDGSVTVSATDLDIRNLVFATDKVDVSGSSVIISDGSGPITVDGTVNIGTMPEVEIKNESGNPIPVTGTVTITDGSGPITVDATDLDIRNLTFASDKVDVSGSSITATVTATALDIRALDCGTDSVSICDGTNNLAIDTNGSISSNLYANDLVSGSVELVTTTGGVGYQALDVNVVAPINTITPNILSTISSGTIAASVYSITFFNAGNDTELVSFDSGTNWVNLLPGVTISMDAGGIANKYPAGVFAYDVIASGPIIITYNS